MLNCHKKKSLPSTGFCDFYNKRCFLILFLSVLFCLPLQAADGIYGPINRQDTLWNIAEKLRPSNNLTTQQVMMALYQKNPHAFTVNNISSLRKNAHLLAPTEAEVKSIKRKTAIAMVQRHNTRWKKRRFVKTNAPVPVELQQKLAAQKTGSTDDQQVGTAADPQQAAQAASADATQTNSNSDAKQAQLTQSQPQAADTGTNTNTNTTAVVNAASVEQAGAPQLSAQLTEVQQELLKTRVENQRLKNELLALKKAQKQTAVTSETGQQIQVQLDALKHELAELRTILTQKDNHIKVLQASLKDASTAIKSQHADNMRLYNKLKELSPESVAVMAANAASKQNTQAKPQLELAELSPKPAPAALTATQAANNSNNSGPNVDAGIAKVWADEAPGGGQLAQSATSADVNTLRSGDSVTLGEILSSQAPAPAVEQQQAQTSGFSFSTNRSAKVSPIAWAAVLISIVFIFFMIVRALLMQNELRRFEMDEVSAKAAS